MNTLAIIPARSGSKGLKDKNIKLLCDKPLIAYSIQAAQESNIFSEIMVSTDSEYYAEIAKSFGASVPFLRSKNNSSDSASTNDAIKEVLDSYKALGKVFDSFCILQPTSPLRTTQDIINAWKIFQNAEVAVISVCEAEHSPLWCNILPENSSLENFIPEANNKRRQEQGKFYRINGALYFVRVPAFIENNYLYRTGSFAYVMSKRHSIDIDDEFDFRLAEFIMSQQGQQAQ